LGQSIIGWYKQNMMQKQWRLAARPEGIPDRSHFSLTDAPIPALQPGKAVAKTLYLGVRTGDVALHA
jgi:NADPH-dependent curcumin reductase CurA